MKRRVAVLMLVLSLLPGCQGSGDRVLVAKFVYDTHAVPPDRNDVVVFKYPAMPMENGTPKNYIKRLIGLPGEIIALLLGRIYIFVPPAQGVPEGVTAQEWKDLADTSYCDPLDLWKGPRPLEKEGKEGRLTPKNYMHPTAQKLWNENKFKIAHKPPAVMLALSRPVFDNDHQAADLKGVWPDRWAPQGGAGWTADSASGFKTAGLGQAQDWLRYRHLRRPSDWPAANQEDRLRRIEEIKASSKPWPQLVTDVLGYNTYVTPGHMTLEPNWVGDLMLSCKLTVEEPRGEFWMELSRGVDRFQARFDLATGVCSLWRWSDHRMKKVAENGVEKLVPDWQELKPLQNQSNKANTAIKAKGEYSIRFANYDDRLTVWVGHDLPFEDGRAYDPPSQLGPDTPEDKDARKSGNLDAITNNDLQPASMCSVGAVVEVHNIQLWRDTYYTGFTEHGMVTSDHASSIQGLQWGYPENWTSLRNLQAKTVYVYPGHYFCLGDNSQESSDSREWGLVPNRLMLGRALLVYFPFDRAGVIR